MSGIHFNGEWQLVPALAAALATALAAFVLYRHEIRRLAIGGASLLPWLRASAVFMLTLMLAGPVLKVRETEGTLTRLLIFTDGSQSMDVTDPEMDVVRKLAVVRSLKWLPPTARGGRLAETAEKLSAAIERFQGATTTSNLKPSEFKEQLEAFIESFRAVQSLASSGAISADEANALERQVIAPAKRLKERQARSASNFEPGGKESLELIKAAENWRQTLLQRTRAEAVAETGSERTIAAALERLGQTSRIERVRSVLLDGGGSSLLSELSSDFAVELFTLQNQHARLLWSSGDRIENIPPALPPANGTSTDIGRAILEQVTASRMKSGAGGDNAGRTVVVLFTDGRHNAAGFPGEVAKTLGDRGVPVYCIGTGSQDNPPDLAITGVEAPETIFFEDRVSGTVGIKDDMPSGQPYTVQISLGDKIVWRKELLTAQHSVQKIAFDFSVKELAEAAPQGDGGHRSVLPLSFQASVSVLPKEREIRNNSSRFMVRATTGKRKLLILDGRPRWESRYVRTLFERDPQWQVNAVIGDPANQNPWLRGGTPGAFPSDQQQLSEYDMIVFGDVPRQMLTEEEFQWIADFVAKRGGGILFLDGARRSLAGYGVSPLARLLPVTFPAAEADAPDPSATALELTERGRAMASLKLEENAGGEASTWKTLAPPKRLTRCQALPGTEILLEAVVESARMPALVVRQYGTGHVGYMAFDETWRWRNGVAGKYQERFWNQLIGALAEPTFSTTDEVVSLDTDAFQYAPGTVARLRARVRDGKSRSSIEGSLWRDAKKIASIQMENSADRSDLFSGRTNPLQPGIYEFRVEGVEGQTNAPVRVRFEVESPQSGELSELTLNEGLLRQIATDSHGAYLREERARTLPELISPMKTGRVFETEHLLWQSYGWFGLVAGLLGLELLLRKRLGLL